MKKAHAYKFVLTLNHKIMLTLKNVLRVNALSSGLTGLLLTFFPGVFRDLFEVSHAAPFIGVGIFLVVFSILVAIVSANHPVSHSAVLAVTIADSAWVLASIAVILMPISMSIIGTALIIAVAGWVLMMAVLQMRGLRQTPAAMNP